MTQQTTTHWTRNVDAESQQRTPFMQNLCHALTALTDRLCLTRRVALSFHKDVGSPVAGDIDFLWEGESEFQGALLYNCIIDVQPALGGCAMDTMVVPLVHARALMEKHLLQLILSFARLLQAGTAILTQIQPLWVGHIMHRLAGHSFLQKGIRCL